MGVVQAERAGAVLARRPRLVDLALAAGVCGVLVVVLPGTPPLRTALLLLLTYAALVWRRTAPAPSAMAVFAGAFGAWLVAALSEQNLTSATLPAGGAVLLAVYSVAAHGPGWARAWGLVVGLAGAALGAALPLAQSVRSRDLLLQHPREVLVPAGVLAVLVGLAWTAGQWRRTRIAFIESLVARARDAEHQREQEAALASAVERARIARELHDIVAHSLSVIISQADGGRYAAAASPQAAVEALATVSATGRTALADMRSLLGVLRDEQAAGLSPQPGVESLPDLVEAVRRSGLSVRLSTRGTAQPLSPGAGLAVYRTVQEALTNVLRHGGPAAQVEVVLEWTADGLTVRIEDDGRGAAAAGDGEGGGLRGMRERVALHGGRVHAGPRAGGGFQVRAELPLTEVPA